LRPRSKENLSAATRSSIWLSRQQKIRAGAKDAVNAACSGYLNALQVAYDHLQFQPNGRVLVVTSEVSPGWA
jgi:3-oxoacyl-[acyl-carrier-protein] synthase III